MIAQIAQIARIAQIRHYTLQAAGACASGNPAPIDAVQCKKPEASRPGTGDP